MRLILPRHITAFLPQQALCSLPPVSLTYLLSPLTIWCHAPFSTWKTWNQVCKRHQFLHHIDFSFHLEVSFTVRARCATSMEVCFQLPGVCWWTCYVFTSLGMLVVSCFAEGFCRRQLTKWWEHHHFLCCLVCIVCGSWGGLGGVCIQTHTLLSPQAIPLQAECIHFAPRSTPEKLSLPCTSCIRV